MMQGTLGVHEYEAVLLLRRQASSVGEHAEAHLCQLGLLRLVVMPATEREAEAGAGTQSAGPTSTSEQSSSKVIYLGWALLAALTTLVLQGT